MGEEVAMQLFYVRSVVFIEGHLRDQFMLSQIVVYGINLRNIVELV